MTKTELQNQVIKTQSLDALTQAHGNIMNAWRGGEITITERQDLFRLVRIRRDANSSAHTLTAQDDRFLNGDGGLGCGE